jgi:hypothetical protein
MSTDKQESIDVVELLHGIVKEEVDKLNEVSPQDPAVIDKTPDIDIKKEEEIKKGDRNFMYKWIRSKSGK